MAINPDSPCPGGLDKPIRSCCPALVKDWVKIDRMLEGRQYAACLQHVEWLERQHPDRACLLATKILLLRSGDRLEDAQLVADTFLAKYPNNPVALAEMAILTAQVKTGAEAVPVLERAIAASDNQMDVRVYQAIGVVSRALAEDGEPLAARELALTQVALDRADREPVEFVLGYNASEVPLVLKEDWRLPVAPEDAPWKAEYDEARAMAARMQRTGAAAKLAALTERYPDVPALWRGLGILRAWAADSQGAAEALHKFAALSAPGDDAVEAELLALLLAKDPLGDLFPLFELEYELEDFEPVHEALVSSPRIIPLPIDPRSLGVEGEPPPKAACYLLDRAIPLTHTGVTADTIPQTLCQFLLYGKQTDRKARLEVRGVAEPHLAMVKQQFNQLTEDRLGAPAKEEFHNRVSATRDSLVRHWQLPRDMTEEHFQQLSREFWEAALLGRFPQQPLPCLDGKSPQEAAGQEGSRVKVLAVLDVLKSYIEETGTEFDVGRVRQHLGLPTPEPVDPRQVPIGEVPLSRLARVMPDRLDDKELKTAFARAYAFHARDALQKIGRELAARPSLAQDEDRLHALASLARTVRDWKEAQGFIQQGREAAVAADKSCAAWDLMELTGRVSHAEAEEAVALIRHVYERHQREANVINQLGELLARLGVLRPDGTMAIPSAKPVAEPSIVVPGESDQSGQPASKIVLPGGESPAGPRKIIWGDDMG